MSLIAEINPSVPCQMTRERLAGSNLKLTTSYLPLEKEVIVFEDVKMTLGKAIELNLAKDTDYRGLDDSYIITVKVPKTAKFSFGFQKYQKVTKAIGWKSTGYRESVDDDDDADGKDASAKAENKKADDTTASIEADSKKKKKKKADVKCASTEASAKAENKKKADTLHRKVNYRSNNAKLTDRPYELNFVAKNSKSLLESLDIAETSDSRKSVSVWRYLTEYLPFELTDRSVPAIMAIACLRLKVPEEPKMAPVRQRVEVSNSSGKLVSYVYHDSKGQTQLGNPLQGVTVLGSVGKDKLLVIYNDDKLKKKHVIDKPKVDSAVIPPSVEIKYIFLVVDQCGDDFLCDYVSDGSRYRVKLTIPFNIQDLCLVRNFVLWVPNNVDVVNEH